MNETAPDTAIAAPPSEEDRKRPLPSKVLWRKRPPRTVRSHGLPQFPGRAVAMQVPDADEEAFGAPRVDASVNDDDDVPCEALLAIESLLQSPDTCLSIPIGASMVLLGVLDCQIHEWFTLRSHASHSSLASSSVWSTRMVDAQLQSLRAARRIRALAIPGRTGALVYVRAADYLAALRAYAAEKEDAAMRRMLDQWITHLSSSESVADQFTVRDWPDALPADLRTVLQQQQWIRRRDGDPRSLDDDMFQLWLPGAWGAQVLPALLHRADNVGAWLRRAQAQERSVRALVEYSYDHRETTRTRRRNDDVPIPTVAVLIPFLVAHGRVRRVVRPAGLALQCTEP